MLAEHPNHLAIVPVVKGGAKDRLKDDISSELEGIEHKIALPYDEPFYMISADCECLVIICAVRA